MRSSRRRQAAIAALRTETDKSRPDIKKHILLLTKAQAKQKEPEHLLMVFSNIDTFFALVDSLAAF